MPNEVKLLPCDDDVRRRLLSVAMTLETCGKHGIPIDFAMLAHDIRAALSRPTTVVTDEVVERVSRALYVVFADLAREHGEATIPDYDRDDAEARDFTIRLARVALASMPTVVTGEQPDI
jgi:hypothetical protein